MKFSQYEALFLFRYIGKKLYFCNSSCNPFDFLLWLVWKEQTRCPKGYDSPWGLCTEQTYDFNLLVYFKFRLSLRSAKFFFYLPCCWASRNPITSVEFKSVARQGDASVVMQAAKLKFVAESRTRVYFVQHVASTCNIVFCCETSWSQTW